MSLQEYLKRYTDDGKSKRTRKKKPKGETVGRIKVVEEDAFLVPSYEGSTVADEDGAFSEEEDKPLLAFQNNKTDELRLLGKFSLCSWTRADGDTENVNQAGSDSSTSSTEVRRKRHDSPESEGKGATVSTLSIEEVTVSVHRRTKYTSSTGRRRRHDSEESVPKGSKNDDDLSPSRRILSKKIKNRSESGVDSPPRKKTEYDKQEQRSSRRRHDSEDSDVSVQRSNRRPTEEISVAKEKMEEGDLSPPRRRRRHDSDSENVPRTRRENSFDKDLSPPRRTSRMVRHRSESEDSVSRKNDDDQSVKSSSKRRRRHDSGSSDLSPPRRRRPSEFLQPDDSPRSVTSKRSHKTSKSSEVGEDLSGRHAEPVVRKKQTIRRGAKQETEEQKRLREELEKKFALWSKGLKQAQDREEKLEELAREIEKPLARYRDDKDLEAHLKGQLHEDDPMFEYMVRKMKKSNPELKERSRRRIGPPNRFGIPPGVRWDGVDRSNGFEARLLSQKNLRAAEREEYYKWAAGSYE